MGTEVLLDMNRIILFLVFLIIVAPARAEPTILIVGDSLSAGYGIDTMQGWVSLLQHRLRKKGYRYILINASVSGDTSAGALARLPLTLQRTRPDIVILEIGGNDGLQGLPLAEMKNNLSRMIELGKKQGAAVLLLGVRLPPNYGPVYTNGFDDAFTQVARKNQILLVPRFLLGVAGNRKFMQQDGIHPLAEGQQKMLDNVWPRLEIILKR